MTSPSERILLALDAHECWAGVVVRPALSPVEDIVVHREGGASFGTVAGQQSVAELQDLMTLWAYRLGQLDTWYGVASPLWVGKDSVGFIAFTNDWNQLHNRYNAALNGANNAVTAAKLSFATPNSMIPAQQQYNALTKAMRQCAPPDGCPVVKGDWADLYQRAAAVSASLGIAPPPDAPPQPVATDLDQSVFADTASADVVAQVSGAQSSNTGPLPGWVARKLGGLPPQPGDPTGGLLVWLLEHKTAVLIGGAVVIALPILGPVIISALKTAKGVAALAA